MTITPRLVALEAVLLAFLAFTGYAIYLHGYVGFFEQMLASSVSMLIFTDLVICLTLVEVWMFFDARERSLPFAPYLAIGLLLGSAGPLMYLIHREVRAARAPIAAPAG